VRDIVGYDADSGVATLENHLVYDSFGNVLSESGSTTTLFGYTGRELDRESIFQFNRTRYYVSSLGVWASEDPIGFAAGDANVRRYVGYSVTNSVDPSGLQEILSDAEIDPTITGGALIEGPKKWPRWENERSRGFLSGVVVDFVVAFYWLTDQGPYDAGPAVRGSVNLIYGPDFEYEAQRRREECKDRAAAGDLSVGIPAFDTPVLYGIIISPRRLSGHGFRVQAPRSGYLRDFQTKRTVQRSCTFNSEGHARQLAREKLGQNPVMVGDNKLRSVDGRWQYRAKPVDTTQNHVHLERLDPETGEVLENWHLNWPEGAGR
jgi:RHS repeat-associated protein